MSEPNFDPAVNGTGQEQVGQAGMFSQPQSPQGQAPEPEKINPVWNGLLSKIPDQNLQKLIMPELKRFDQEHSKGLDKVHSQYAPYKPFLDAQVNPEDLNNALMVYQSMEQDPEKFIRAIAEFYKVNLEQGQNAGEQPPEPTYDSGEQQPFDLTQHPEFLRQQQIVEQLAQGYMLQQNQAQEAEDDAALDAELEAARQKFGEFDEDLVMQNMIFHNLSAEDAVTKVREYEQKVVQNYRSPGSQAPIIAGGGGGVPSQQIPVSQLTAKDRKQLMVERLAQAAAQGR